MERKEMDNIIDKVSANKNQIASIFINQCDNKKDKINELYKNKVINKELNIILLSLCDICNDYNELNHIIHEHLVKTEIHIYEHHIEGDGIIGYKFIVRTPFEIILYRYVKEFNFLFKQTNVFHHYFGFSDIENAIIKGDTIKTQDNFRLKTALRSSMIEDFIRDEKNIKEESDNKIKKVLEFYITQDRYIELIRFQHRLY